MEETLRTNLDVLQKVLSHLPEGFSLTEMKRILVLVSDLDTTPLRVSVVGPFDSGKSSIVNALIGRPLLPTSIKETTATSFRISSISPASEEHIELADGRRLPLDQIAKANSSQQQQVRVLVHSESIPVGFEILDTPGLSSAFEVHEKITADALLLADVLLLVVDAKQGLSQAMVEFLNKNPRFAAKTFVCLNKADLLPDSDRNKVLEYNTHACGHLRPAGVMLVSAMGAPGMQALMEQLLHELPPRAAAVKGEVAAKRLVALSRNVMLILKEVRDSIHLSTTEIDVRIQELTRKREAVTGQVDRRTRDLVAAIKSECRQSVVSFERKAMSCVDVWTQRIGEGEPATGFSSELRSLWEAEAGQLSERVGRLVGEYRADLQGIAVDASIQVPWWTDWVDWAFAALAIIGPMTGGWGNLLEATVGKLFGQEIKKRIVRGVVQKSLQAAVVQWVSQVGRQVDSRMTALAEDANRHVRAELEPQLREAEEALENLKQKKAGKIVDAETARRLAEEDLEAVKVVVESLGK